ncbi:hypothetical protein PR202_gb17499 [Eleusine coracana subsp. coracana]|uniref:Uncharacterized protein n=1 Tax=Eleusine coracana subsp. coracana TaxID=191504 RepID=A0AAV5F2X8_ELECO|nr:hypothetical protein PR202_gb17499 [Eleusine coracana subsp. coracana]
MKTWLPHRNYEPQYLRLVSDQTSASQAESTDQDKGSSLQRMPEAEEQTVTNPSGKVVASEDPVVPEEPLAEYFPLLPHLLQLVVLRVHALPS